MPLGKIGGAVRTGEIGGEHHDPRVPVREIGELLTEYERRDRTDIAAIERALVP
ncbi:hypothetical protein ABQE45_17715 [Mycobacteroides chelonae]